MPARPASVKQRPRATAAQAVGVAQGLYFLGTGLWPLLHMRSFLAVTGPKYDLWLVNTVGALIAVVGTALVTASCEDRLTPDIRRLAAGSALALGAIDVIYSWRRRIPPVYLIDGVTEAALLAFWICAASRPRRSH
jgi:hypothetical protein